MSVDLEKLTKPFPREAIKTREGARGRKFSYVETQTVIRRLNEATGNNWDFRVVQREWRGDLLITIGELTLPGLGTRTGTGVQRVADGAGEDLVKGSLSDALKKAATLFGIGLEFYGDDYEAVAAEREERQAARAPQRAGADEQVGPNEPASDEMRAQLKEAMERAGWTSDDFRAWRTANDAYAWSRLTIRQAGALSADLKMGLRPGAKTQQAAPKPANGRMADLEELEEVMP